MVTPRKHSRVKANVLLYFDNGAFLPEIHIILCFVYSLDNDANYVFEESTNTED